MNSESPIPNSEGQKKSGEQQANTDPQVLPALIESHPQIPPNSHCKRHKYSRDGWDWLKYGMEAVGLVALIFYTIFAGCQTKIATDTFKETHESVALQRQVAQATFGAYVDLNKSWMGVYRSEKTIWARVQVENYGKTDADSVSVKSIVEFRNSDPDKSDWNLIDKLKPISTNVNPVVPLSVKKQFVFIQQDMEQKATEKARLYAWGRIYYKSFGSDVLPTDFCQYVSAKTILDLPNTPYRTGQDGWGGPYTPCEQTAENKTP